jgi:hypothetical protein
MDEKEQKQPTRAPKTFAQTLQDHHYGFTAQEATDKLAEAISVSERTGKATEVTIKMKIKPVSKAQGRYDVVIDVENKLPPKEREAAIMFVGPEGNLQNSDPRQLEISGLRVVDKNTQDGAVRADQGHQDQPGVRVG